MLLGELVPFFDDCLLGGGFRYFLFSSLFGEDSRFDQYFSNGLKRPTSYFWSLCIFSETVLSSIAVRNVEAIFYESGKKKGPTQVFHSGQTSQARNN